MFAFGRHLYCTAHLSYIVFIVYVLFDQTYELAVVFELQNCFEHLAYM